MWKNLTRARHAMRVIVKPESMVIQKGMDTNIVQPPVYGQVVA